MNLVVSTPTAVVIDANDVSSLRAEDPTGGFGILPGHADFLTVLLPSVLRWRDQDNHEFYVAVRGGVFTVRNGMDISVASREAVAGDSLEDLELNVIARFTAQRESEAESRTRAMRLHLEAMRQVWRYIQAGYANRGPGLHKPLGINIERGEGEQ